MFILQNSAIILKLLLFTRCMLICMTKLCQYDVYMIILIPFYDLGGVWLTSAKILLVI